jgi:hypothetical protein
LCQTQSFDLYFENFSVLRSYTNPPSSEVENLRCSAFNVGPLFLRKASFALTVERPHITPAAHPLSLPR